MYIFRFVIRAYPSSKHLHLHEWQKATLVLFIAENSLLLAEQKSIQELNKRNWIPESFEIRDTLIEEAVRTEGGAVLDAYLEAKKNKIFWLESLDSLPMTKKENTVWPSVPVLNESFVDSLITNSGGHRVTSSEAKGFTKKSADYILNPYVLELKQLEEEGLNISTRQEKIVKIFERYSLNPSVQQIDPYLLNAKDAKEYWNLVGVPIQRRIRAASKQVKSTISHLNRNDLIGGIILLNTGYMSIPHKDLIAMAKRYASKDTSSISEVIIISSWLITNGFDTTMNYAFHPQNSNRTELTRLKDTFWSSIESMMTQTITGKPTNIENIQAPIVPIHFQNNGKAYTFGSPQVQSSLLKKKNDT